MTRAKDELHLMIPQRFYVHQQSAQGNRHVYALRSRFIPSQILDRFDERTWPVPNAEGAVGSLAAGKSAPGKINLGAIMSGMWD